MLDLFTAKSRTMCRNLRRVSRFASYNGLKPLFPLACGGLIEQQCVPSSLVSKTLWRPVEGWAAVGRIWESHRLAGSVAR